jgi:glycine cleavage system H protein
MSILLVLLTLLLILAVGHLRKREQASSVAVQAVTRVEAFPQRESVLEIPKGYYFHPCHTWVANEGEENARVGLDSFAADLFGTIDHIEVLGLNRWVRQGQRLMTVSRAGISVDLWSPVEGTVKALNEAVLRDPTLVVTDPYRDGWIAVIKSPDIRGNLKNLLHGAILRSWMRNNLVRLTEMVSQFSPALAQDGGPPLRGLLTTISLELQNRLVKEFFLTLPESSARGSPLSPQLSG